MEEEQGQGEVVVSDFDEGYQLAMRETADQIGMNLARALVRAQAMMPSVHKDAANPYFKSKYATLAACVEAARTVLAETGLAVVQFPISEGDQIGLRTLVVHESGEYLEDRMLMKNQKPGDAQYFGSAITYFRRYAFCSALGIVADDDDDGNKASLKQSPQEPKLEPTAEAKDSAVYHGSNDQKLILLKICTELGVASKDSMAAISAAAIDTKVMMSELVGFTKWYLKENT
jgi:hypothetical protein